MKKSVSALALVALAMGAATPALAAKKKAEPVQLSTCTESYGTVAVVDGDTQGWTKYGLSSPRELINALALESGCFSPHNPASGKPADFLLNVVAGDAEEVDKSIELAKSAATEGLIRSGAAGTVLSRVPMGGALLGAFGGLGGKKKVVAAGIKVLSPATGQTIATGSGEVRKSTLTFGGAGGWNQGVQNAGYGSSKDGQMLAEAFIIAFNAVAAQGPVLAQAPRAAAPAAALASVAADTVMRAAPAGDAAEVRKLRSGTTLTPTGKRDGLFVEVEDSFGTKGWVSVEDLG
ncbi:MAG: SH3 domain-containing protein [Sphingomonadaceae bacterium]|nr:SH3 domain-containing protein [Sphingomonadaceae bacterium]